MYLGHYTRWVVTLYRSLQVWNLAQRIILPDSTSTSFCISNFDRVTQNSSSQEMKFLCWRNVHKGTPKYLKPEYNSGGGDCVLRTAITFTDFYVQVNKPARPTCGFRKSLQWIINNSKSRRANIFLASLLPIRFLFISLFNWIHYWWIRVKRKSWQWDIQVCSWFWNFLNIESNIMYK